MHSRACASNKRSLRPATQSRCSQKNKQHTHKSDQATSLLRIHLRVKSKVLMMVSKATLAPIPLTHSDLRHILNAPATGLAHLLGTLPPGTIHLLQDLTQRLPGARCPVKRLSLSTTPNPLIPFYSFILPLCLTPFNMLCDLLMYCGHCLLFNPQKSKDCCLFCSVFPGPSSMPGTW